MLKIVQKGDWDRAVRDLDGFSPRRLRAAVATALTRTAVDVRDELKRELLATIDRPTPYTLSALRYLPATADRLQAHVGFDINRVSDIRGATTGYARGDTPASYYLRHQVEGGSRRFKRFEVALQAAGALPKGYYAVPGVGATIDAHGNMSRGQVIQILSQLRITMTAGHTRNMSHDVRKAIRAQRKAGGRYFVMRPGGKVQPGIYIREFMGDNITPVVVFVRNAIYRPRFRFNEVGERVASSRFPVQLQRAIAEQRERLVARPARG